MNKFVELAKESYKDDKLSRPDWTEDVSRPEGPLWLNKNENIDPVLNQKLRSLLADVKPEAINTYPELAKVYKKLAKLEDISPKNILLTHGSDGAIRAVFDVFIKPGDKVLHTAPTFAMYDVYSKMYGAQQIQFKYEYHSGGPSFHFARFLELIQTEKPKLVCLPNPDSPTGTALKPEEMQQLLNLTEKVGALLLIDEAYFPFYPESVLSKVNAQPNLLVCRSFSKAWGAAGFRVGFLAADPALMTLIHKSRPMYELSTFSSEVVYILLDHWQDVLASVERLKQGRDYFVNAMKTFGYTTTESHGNFVHVDFGKDEAIIGEALKDTVLYRTDFNQASCLKGFSRFSLATKDQFAGVVQKMKSVQT